MDKIAFAVKIYLNQTETFIYEPLKTFSSYEVIILTEKKKNLDQFPHPHVYSFSDLPPWQRFRLGRLGYFKKMIQEHKPKLIHAHFGWEGTFLLPLKKHFDLPLITSFYGLDVYILPKSPLVRWQLRRLFAEGDLFLTYSEKMKKDVIALGCDESKVRAHHGGVDFNKFKFSPRKPGAAGEFRILMVGRFVEKKGIDIGIKAFARSFAKHRQLRLNIIGSGALGKKYQRLIEELGLSKYISLLGPKTYSEYIAEIESSHLLLAPSVAARNGDEEGGINATVIEALATGLPGIATLHSGSELVVSDKTGFMVPEKDVAKLSQKIDQLVEQPSLLEKFGRAGRVLIEQKFDIIKQTQKLENTYKETIQNHAKLRRDV